MNDNKKKLTPQLEIDTEFFHRASSYDVKPKAHWSGVRLTVHWQIGAKLPITVRDGAVVMESLRIGDG
jgi:hypothetical protein